MNRKFLALFLILLVAFVFRVYDFGNTPAGISDDEASHGYNAYSLLQTGRDEYGKSWPIFLRSFGTYASSLYTYMTIVPVKLLGLNIVSTRIVSLVSGLILVLVATIALGPVTGLVVAISPVFVFYSRAAFETNLSLALLFIGLVLSLKRHRSLLAAIFISLSAYAYQTERILSLVIAAWKKLLILVLIIQIPLLYFSFTAGSRSRISTLAHTGSVVKKAADYSFLYLSYFSPNNLFSRPDPAPNKSFPEVSCFYWWMIVPFLIGIATIYKNKEYHSPLAKSLLVLMFASPAIAATTRDYFSTWRALPMFLGLAWIISRGLESLIRKKTFIYAILVIFSSLEIYSNLVLQKHEQSVSWGYHYQKLAEFVRNNTSEPIIIDNTRGPSSYIWLYFYNKYPSPRLQLTDYYNHVQFDSNVNVNNIQVRPINWDADVYVKEYLVADPLGISDKQAQEHHLTFVSFIPDINGQPALNIYFNSSPKTKP